MPVPDPSSGRKFIWLIACFLFISLIAGGVCLVAYMYLPESETSSWVPVVGVGLVCLPWAFWFFTCLYRIFSRCLGCRVGMMGGGGGGGSWGGANQPRNADVEVAAQSTKGGSSGGGELNRASSIASNESEMALAKSMSS